MNVLILDDHPAVAHGLARFLIGHGHVVVYQGGDPNAALLAAQAKKPDVALVDIKVNGGYSFDFARLAGATVPSMKLVFVTGHDDDVFVTKAMALGATGYVLKSAPLEDIQKAIESAARGKLFVSSGVAVRSETGMMMRADQLTKREREILHYVSLGRSAREIAEALKISVFTVTNHKSNIMAKLDIHSQVGLTRFAIANGLASL